MKAPSKIKQPLTRNKCSELLTGNLSPSCICRRFINESEEPCLHFGFIENEACIAAYFGSLDHCFSSLWQKVILTCCIQEHYFWCIKIRLSEDNHLGLGLVLELKKNTVHFNRVKNIKVEIILKEREVAFLSLSNMLSTFEFFYCAPKKFKCWRHIAGW